MTAWRQKAVLAAVLILAVVPARAADLTVRGWAHSEFGRLVFDWKRPTAHKASLADRTLRIEFETPVDAPLAGLGKTLTAYLEPPRLSPDRRTITARVKGDFRLRALASRNVVIVDLIRADGKPPSKDAPRAAPKRAAPRVGVRTGIHARFGRVVFDWTADVAYTVARDGRGVVVHFRSPADIALAKARRRLPRQIRSLNAVRGTRGVDIALAVAPDARYRHFRDGTRVVVDVFGKAGPGAAAPARGAEATEGAAAPAHPTDPSRDVKAARTEDAKAHKAPAEAVRKGETVAPKGGSPKAASHLPAHKPPPPHGRKSSPSHAHKPFRPPTAKPRGRPPGGKPFRQLVSVDAERKGGGLVVTFNWRERTSAAAFRRGDAVWLLFDKQARLDLGAIRVAGRGLIGTARQMDAPGTAWLKLAVPPSFAVRADRRGDVWEFALGPRVDRRPGAGKIRLRADRDAAAGARIAVEMEPGGAVLELTDPEIGDRLAVVPVRDPAAFLSRPYDAAQFAMPATAAGLAVRRKAGDLTVRSTRSGIEISAPGGLLLAAAADVARPPREKRPAESRRSLSHIREWGGDMELGVASARQRLIERIVAAPKSERRARRLDMARFYLARRMPAAALGVLGMAKSQDESIERDVDFRALRGAASYLFGHYGEAAADLSFSFLMDDASVAPWRGALAAAKGDWQAAHRLLKRSEAIIADYPSWMANRFLLLAAEASLAVDDLKTADRRLNAARTASDLTDSDRQQTEYLRAFLMKKRGKVREALEMWNTLTASDNRKVRAKSAFAETETLLERGKIGMDEAVERLQRLTVAWRGDAFEFDVLRRLGDLHNKNRDPRNALTRYRQAASYFQGVQGAEQMTKRMSETFDRLYMKGEADRLPPVRALALYQEFRELTPAGAAGDEMIRKLAERLAGVDLLSEAAELLDHQIEYRLKGVKKAEAGARLAGLRLKDLSPDAALKALDKSRIEDMPTDLGRERRLFRARALARVGRGADALKTLRGMTDRDAEIARLEAHWRGGDWKRAGATIARLFDGVGARELGEADHPLVLRWAIALALSGDAAGLAALRERFAFAMRNGPQGAAFLAVAGRGPLEAPDYRTLVRQAGELDTFESFMSSYRRRTRAKPVAVN